MQDAIGLSRLDKLERAGKVPGVKESEVNGRKADDGNDVLSRVLVLFADHVAFLHPRRFIGL